MMVVVLMVAPHVPHSVYSPDLGNIKVMNKTYIFQTWETIK